MWRCSYCRKRFEHRDDGINHARGYHSRDYACCEYVPRTRSWAGGRAVLTALIDATAALLTRAR